MVEHAGSAQITPGTATMLLDGVQMPLPVYRVEQSQITAMIAAAVEDVLRRSKGPQLEALAKGRPASIETRRKITPEKLADTAHIRSIKRRAEKIGVSERGLRKALEKAAQ